MFTNLTENLSNVFGKLRGKGVLSESDINAAMREVRIALLEADVSLPAVKDFIARAKQKALGVAIIKNTNPAQMVIKIVQDELEAMLGDDTAELNLNVPAPAVILMAGLQGSGKTTSCAKIAHFLATKHKKKVLMASLDIYRPAAREQLAALGTQGKIATLPIKDKSVEALTRDAIEEAKLGGFDVLILDTAGRLHVDDDLMGELKNIAKIAKPTDTLLVADSLTGQDAVTIAEQFHRQLSSSGNGITGLVLTRMDGDGRGGAALSMRAVTGCPIMFVGVGEKISELERFHPERVASRILGMGDVVTLVEKAAEQVDEAEAQRLTKKMQKGEFTFVDLFKQLESMQKMGGIGNMLGHLPGMGKMKDKLGEVDTDKIVNKQKAIIQSMTKKERRFPKLMNSSRKQRIASGSGASIQEVNQLLKQFKQMQGMMKKMSKMKKTDMLRMMSQMGKGGFPQ